MFRHIDVGDDIVLKIDLYKNRREKVCEIPLDFVDNITYKFCDIDEVSLNIPRYVTLRGKLVTNNVYSKINTRQQIVVTTISKDGSTTQQRFILHNKKVFGSRDSGSKSFVAYSWEKTLEKQRITIEQLSRQLTNKDDDVHVAEGILDLICKKTGWNVGYVDRDARYKTSSAVETFNVNLFDKYETNVITENAVIFDTKVNIPASGQKPTYLTINYTNLKTIHGTTALTNVNIVNNLSATPIHTTITNIRAEHYSEAANRYGIKYILTLDVPVTNPNDTNKIEIVTTFTNCINKRISADKIFINYDYGDLVEVENIQYANFEAFDDSAYKFLQDVEEIFDCKFIYGTMDNTINVYANNNLMDNNGYMLSMERNIDSVDITENDEIITCLKVESENVSIASENPNGTNILENYDYYIRHNLMSESLKSALEKHGIIIKKRQEEWLRAKEDRSIIQQRYTKSESEARSLEERIKNLTFRLTQFITDGQANEQAAAKAEIAALELQYNQVVREMAEYKKEIDALEDTMAAISVSINKVTAVDENDVPIFSEDDLKELNDMHEIATYSDSYYTTSYGLYNYAVKYLEDRVKPTISFNLTAEELTSQITNINGWNNVIKLGNLFSLEKHDIFDEFDISEIRLTQYKLTPLENGERFRVDNFTFTNKIKSDAPLRVGSNIGRTTNKTSGVITSFRELWEKSKVVNNFVGDMITSGLNIAAANIKGGVYRNILDFSEAGCFIINNTDGNTDNQIYIGGGTICITTDGFATSKVAIDSNGVIAEALVGKLIMGEQLVITSDDGLFYVGEGERQEQKDRDEFGLYIYNNAGGVDRIFLGLSKDNDGVRRAKLRLKDVTGNQVVLSEEGIVQTSQFVCWDNVSSGYPMRIPYFCDDGVKENRRIILSMVFEKYRAFERGMTSGGSLNTSSSGGGGTSSAGGGGITGGGGSTSMAGGATTSSSAGNANISTTSASGGSVNKVLSNAAGQISLAEQMRMTTVPLNSDNVALYRDHYHGLQPEFFLHRHNVNIVIDSHAHSVSVNVPSHQHSVPAHSHTIGAHTHTIPSHTHTIPNHNHTIDTAHRHDLEYGIFEQVSMCSNVRVYVNNVLVNGSPINSDVDLDITKHIKVGKRNDIRIETDSNGRISCNLFTKSFVAF